MDETVAARNLEKSKTRRWFEQWTLPLLFFVVAWFHFTRDNQFPYIYHTDEPGKVAQVLKAEWNLRHPPLLLLTAKGVFRMLGSPESPQTIAVIGRGVSAFFAAGAVAGLVLLAQNSFGLLTGVLAGVLGLASGQLFELAHYFKEDTALLFGFVLAWLAMSRAARQPGWSSAIMLGAAAAVATSAKYVGILALVFAVAMEALSRLQLQPRRLWQGQLVLLGAFLVAIAILNVPLLADTALFSKALKTEIHAVVEGEGGIAHNSPFERYAKSLLDMGWPIVSAGLLGMVFCGALPRAYCRLPRLLALFPIVYFALIAGSPKTSSRYLLPVTVALGFFAAIVPAIIAELAKRRLGRLPVVAQKAIPAALATALAAGLVVAQGSNLMPTLEGFRRDARSELISFLNARHAPDVKLVVERRAGIDLEIDAKEKLRPFDLQLIECAADLGTLQELRTQGVDYIVTHGPTRHMFVSNTFTPNEDVREDYERRRNFYEQLERECRVVWKTRKSKVLYLSPDLRLYDLAQAPEPKKPGGSRK